MRTEVGDTVLYHMGSKDLTVLARVTAVDPRDGDVDLELGPDHPGALDVKKGQGPHTFEPLGEVVDWTLEVTIPSLYKPSGYTERDAGTPFGHHSTGGDDDRSTHERSAP